MKNLEQTILSVLTESELKFSNVEGALGVTPNNIEVGYFGFTVMMKPSMFLSLAAPLNKPVSKEFILKAIEEGRPVAHPMLYIEVPDEWKDGDLSSGEAQVSTHEGRNRCLAVMDLVGDDPIPVDILLRSPHREWRARNINQEIKNKLNLGIIPERSSFMKDGPIFTA